MKLFKKGVVLECCRGSMLSSKNIIINTHPDKKIIFTDINLYYFTLKNKEANSPNY